jgi:tetratricopeptide (TPR) repeat protein
MVAAMANLGNAYFARQRYDTAIEQYRRALALAPDDESVRCNLAAAYSNTALYEKAAAEYLLAIRIEPQFARAHKGLVYPLYRLGRCEEALEHAAIAAELGEQADAKLVAALKEECGND